MFFHTIKFRLTLWYLGVLTIILIFFSFASYLLLYYNVYQDMDNSLRLRVIEINNTLSTGDPQEQIVVQEQLGELVAIYDVNGNLLLSSGTELEESTIWSLIDYAAVGENTIVTATTTDEQTVHLSAALVRRGWLTAVLIVGRPTTEADNTLNAFRKVLFITVFSTILLAAAGGLFLAARALKPVKEINTTAQSINETDLSRRIKVKTRDELGRLSTTLNNMIERLQEAFERQKQFTADSSHELRTPLSVIEAEATLALRKERTPEEYQKALDSINQEVAYMSSILEKLLMLARADAGKEQLNFEPVSLKELIMTMIPDIANLADEKGLQFESGEMVELQVRGDEVKLKQLLLNLFDNAIKYTLNGIVSVSLHQEDDQAIITVSDTGIGISEEDIPHIFDRFYRVDKARSRSEHGSGLGLAIAKYIVQAHNGEINVTSNIGKGSTVRVRLPLLK